MIAVLICSSLKAQKSDTLLRLPNEEYRDIGIVVGVHQFTNTFIEAGISMTKSKGGCVWSSYYKGKSLSVEYNPFQNRWGIAVTAWTVWFTGIVLGANLNSYSDFKNYDAGIKPFLGFGNGDICLTYGYNFLFINNHVPDINRHCFSLRWHIPVWVSN